MCMWNPGSAEADGLFAMGISWVWILPQGREAICYQAGFLLCSWVAFHFCKTRGPCQANGVHWIEVKIEYGVSCACSLSWWTVRLCSKEPRCMLFWSTTSVSSCSSSAFRFQGCLLCFPVASLTLMIPMEILALCIWAESWDYFWKLPKCPRSALHLCLCAETLALA